MAKLRQIHLDIDLLAPPTKSKLALSKNINKLQREVAMLGGSLNKATKDPEQWVDNRTVLGFMRKLSFRLEKDVKDNFLHNPPGWELTQTAIRVRKYYLNPLSLADDILKASKWSSYGKDGEGYSEGYKTKHKLFSLNAHKSFIKERTKNIFGKSLNRRELKEKVEELYNYKYGKGEIRFEDIPKILEEFFRKIPKGYHHPSATMTGPALVLTGQLMDLTKARVQKVQKAKLGKMEHITYGIQISTSQASYADALFRGGTIKTYWLVIARRSMKSDTEYKFSFPIPLAWASIMKNLNLGKDYKITIEKRSTKVKKRDPFIFRENTLSTLEETGDKFNYKLQEDFDKYIREQL